MSELYHYGIKGMHWGVRRFQNADGSLTAAGRARYNTGSVSGRFSRTLDSDKSIPGRIRNKQYADADRSLSDSKKALRELKDIEEYATNSDSRLARSRISTAIRNKQIENAKRTVADSKDAIRELKEISNSKGYKGIGAQTHEKVAKASDSAKKVLDVAKDPRNYSRTAVAVLPSKKGKQYSNLAWLGNGVSAYFGSLALSEVARWGARSVGAYKVEQMIAKGTPYVQAAIVGGTAGKIVGNNYREAKANRERTQKLMRGR